MFHNTSSPSRFSSILEQYIPLQEDQVDETSEDKVGPSNNKHKIHSRSRLSSRSSTSSKTSPTTSPDSSPLPSKSNSNLNSNINSISKLNNSPMNCGICLNDYLDSTQCFKQTLSNSTSMSMSMSSPSSFISTSPSTSSSSNHSTPTSSPLKHQDQDQHPHKQHNHHHHQHQRRQQKRQQVSVPSPTKSTHRIRRSINNGDYQTILANMKTHTLDHESSSSSLSSSNASLYVNVDVDELKPPMVNRRRGSLPNVIHNNNTNDNNNHGNHSKNTKNQIDNNHDLLPNPILKFTLPSAKNTNSNNNNNNNNAKHLFKQKTKNKTKFTKIAKRKDTSSTNSSNNNATTNANVSTSSPVDIDDIDDDNEEYGDLDDDDLTVRVSNMTSTRGYNLTHNNSHESSRTNSSNGSGNGSNGDGNSISSSSLFHNSNLGFIATTVLDALKKEWDVNEETSSSASISSNTNMNTNKKKKNALQKTSSKVKKMILNNSNKSNNNENDNDNDQHSIKSNDAAIVSQQQLRKNENHKNDLKNSSSNNTNKFVETWLKKANHNNDSSENQIVVRHSQENILMGTPLQFGTSTNHSTSNSNSNRNRSHSTSSHINNKSSSSNNNNERDRNNQNHTNSSSNSNNQHLQLIKKSNSFANFGINSKSIKLKRTTSELLNKVGSPTKKMVATISTRNKNRKHKRALSNQSSIFLSSAYHHNQHHQNDTSSPPRILRFNNSNNKNYYNGNIASTPMSLNDKDDAIKGRLDGIDVLSLGAGRCVSYIGSKDKSLAGQRYTLRSMVSDTLWASSGREVPEIVLEGFSPMGNDRWTVLIEDLGTASSSLENNTRSRQQNELQQKERLRQRYYKHLEMERVIKGTSSSKSRGELDQKMTESTSKSMSTHILLSQIWGKEGPPPPTHAVSFERAHIDGNDIEGGGSSGLRAVSSCPIDVKKDIFIIKESDHLQSAHSIAVVNLKYGQFDESIAVFDKILRSLQHQYHNRDHHLIGACYHNLGVLQMWAGRYEEALIQFNKAITVRIKTMTFSHPSVAVSLSKIGLAYFALEQLDKAMEALEKALDIRKTYQKSGNLEVAKLQNNIAAIHYQKGDKKMALKKYKEALEIMKKLIEGPVRRESIMYDTSVILSNMAKIYLERKNYDMAYHMIEEALMVQTSIFRKNHDCIITSLGNIAFAKGKEGETMKSLQVYKSMLRMQTEKFGSTSCEASETKGLMSVLYIQLGKYKEAHRCLKEVLKWQQRNLDKHHPALTNTENTIRKLRQAIKGARESFADV